MSHLTLIGLGAMGATIGHALLKASYKVTVWNRTPTRPAINTLVEAGATFTPDIKEALSNSDIIVICVMSYDNISQLLLKLDKADLSGKTIINLTNGTPRQAREMSAKLRNEFAGLRTYFDGGIMVPPELVGHDSAFVFISGETGESALTAHPAHGIIGKIGRPVYVSSDPGAASLYDLALLAGMYGMFAGSFVAMALMKRLQPGDKGAQIKEPVVNFLSPLLQYMGPHIAMIATAWDTEDWSAHGNPMEMQGVAIDNILKACEEEGVDGGALRHFAGLMQKVIRQGGGEEGILRLGPLLLQ